jgi:hypothetical protein
MLLVAILAILSGQGSLMGMERFAKRHRKALNELLVNGDNEMGGSRQLHRRVSGRDNRVPIMVRSPSDARPSVVADQGALHGQTGQWP